MNGKTLLPLLCGVAALVGCGARRVEPVELYPEDICANCRMAVSDRRFASELIDADGAVFKFDDLICLESFRGRTGHAAVAAIFVIDYETGAWIPWEKSVVVKTGVSSPMGSGRVALGDSARAEAFLQAHPPERLQGNSKE